MFCIKSSIPPLDEVHSRDFVGDYDAFKVCIVVDVDLLFMQACPCGVNEESVLVA